MYVSNSQAGGGIATLIGTVVGAIGANALEGKSKKKKEKKHRSSSHSGSHHHLSSHGGSSHYSGSTYGGSSAVGGLYPGMYSNNLTFPRFPFLRFRFACASDVVMGLCESRKS